MLKFHNDNPGFTWRNPIATRRPLPLIVAGLMAVVSCHDGFSQTNLAREVAMANPPAITVVGPMMDPPTLINRVLIDRTNAVFRFTGGRLVTWDNSYPHNLFYVSSGITGAYAQLPFRVEFETDARELEVLTLGTGGKFRVKVDHEYADLSAASGPPPDGNFYSVKINFGGAQRRVISFEALGLAFGGVIIAPGDKIFRAEKPLGPKAIVLGDSYTEGLVCYAQRLADLMGWEVWSSGVGGTGYLNPGPAGRVKFRDRVQTDVIAHNPDIVLVAGGINDVSDSPASLRIEAEALYDTILTNLPSAKLVVVGPWWPRGNPPQFVLDARDAFKAAAASRGLEFIDPLVATNASQTNIGWITGTGNAGNPTGDGNADSYISSDGTHPTDLGHQYLALRLKEFLGSISWNDPTPTIDIQLLAGLQVRGSLGRNYLVQIRDEIGASNWVDAATLTLSSSPQLWVDTSSTNRIKRFYRALLLP